MDPLRTPQRYLMGPGPSPVEPAVLEAMRKPLIGHLDPAFLDVMDGVSDGLRAIFRTDNEMTFPVSGTGSAGMEAAIVNVVEPGDTVVAAVCGLFGGRIAEMARRAGAEVVTVEAPWGQPVPSHELAKAAKASSAAVVAVVHAETSTGVRQPVEELRQAIGSGPLLVVDAVTSLGGIRLDVDRWGIDVCYSATQKCLSVPPGLAPITFSERARDKARRRSQIPSWYFDTSLLSEYWSAGGERRAYHHTAPISMIFGLYEGLRLVLDEGLERRWQRHEEAGRFLQEQLAELGFTMVAPSRYRLPQLTAALLPAGVDDAAARRSLLEDFAIEVGGGVGEFAARAWRIGMMGRGASRQAAVRLIQAVESVLGV